MLKILITGQGTYTVSLPKPHAGDQVTRGARHFFTQVFERCTVNDQLSMPSLPTRVKGGRIETICLLHVQSGLRHAGIFWTGATWREMEVFVSELVLEPLVIIDRLPKRMELLLQRHWRPPEAHANKVSNYLGVTP